MSTAAQDPIVSVVIAVRNGAEHVAALRRMLDAQDLEDVEVVVVDDASDDTTAVLLQAWADFEDGVPVRVLRNAQQRGAAATRREGLRVARGRYVWFADADDRFDPDLLSSAVRHAEAHGADVVCFRARAEHEDGSPHPVVLYGRPAPSALRVVDGRGAVDAVFSGEVMGYLWDKLYAREPLARCFDDAVDLRTHEDLLLLLVLVASRPRLVLATEVPYAYVIRESSLSNARRPSYRDLQRCAAAADQVAATGDAGPHYGTFLTRYIGLAALEDAARKGTPADVRGAAAVMRSRLRAATTREVARDHGWALACRATAARVAPTAYARTYGAVRRAARAVSERRR